jgi:hypothetical protein
LKQYLHVSQTQARNVGEWYDVPLDKVREVFLEAKREFHQVKDVIQMMEDEDIEERLLDTNKPVPKPKVTRARK